ncbi:hypothetical protein DSO57_1021049 [Entomophthora muscae]|uniref:Uncharacterized protein n=2 Tax=Entomophthora muscae TaxID=34485 RepID=A0ACC2S626_9FUNG|nr:hypothetical protein DSO57_1019434 [Entomophthora muscae]KAJ9061405.1 hypothetical protein DSO57_1021049 [Entomophthora muscae]
MVALPSPVSLDSRIQESGTSYSSTRTAAFRQRYRSPVTYWPGTNIPIYNMVNGL